MNKKDAFLQFGVYVKNLPYRRNIDRNNIFCPLNEQRGTCSTKHALLKFVADESGIENVKLVLGVFSMNAVNTPKIAAVLKYYQLSEIPEAHNYLKIDSEIYDFTRRGSRPENFVGDLLTEIEVSPLQLNDFKVQYHQKYLEEYLKEKNEIPYSLVEFWQIREECIAALQK